MGVAQTVFDIVVAHWIAINPKENNIFKGIYKMLDVEVTMNKGLGF